MEARARARATEAERLRRLAESDEKAVARLKNRLQWFFERHGLGKIETARFRLGLQNNGGKLPLLITEDAKPEEAEERFHKVIPTRVEFDKDAVRQALEAGEELPFAKLGERGKRIVIK